MPAINVNDLNNAKLDSDTIAAVATSNAFAVTDRLGNSKYTVSGINAAMLASAAAAQASVGYLPPVAYAAGISLTLAAQTVSYTGQTYAPILSALPFTTSGTFETAKFRLIQGVAITDLSAVTGSRLIGWMRNIAGAVQTTLAKWIGWQPVSVFDFMTDAQIADAQSGAPTLDVTAALTLAFANNTTVIGAPGIFRISGPIPVNQAINFIGPGAGSMTILNSASTDILQIGNGTNNPKYVNISGLSFDYAIQQTATTSAVKLRNGKRCKINNMSYSSKCGVAVDLNGGAGQYQYYLNDHEINGSAVGIRYGADGTVLQGVWADTIEIYGCTTAGMLVQGMSGSFLSNIDCVRCFEGIVLAPLTGKRIIANWFTNVLGDSSDRGGWRLTAIAGSSILENTFNSCWSSNSGFVTTSPGFFTEGAGSIDGVYMNGGMHYENKGGGLTLTSGANYSLTGVTSTGNSQAVSNVSHGLYANNIINMTVTGGKYGIGGDFTATQNTGIFLDSAVTNYVINYPDCAGNVTTGVNDTPRKGIVNALGYTNTNDRGTASIVVGQAVAQVTPGFIGGFSGAEIQITQRSSKSASGITDFYVLPVDAQNFQVVANVAVTGANFQFSWQLKKSQ